MTNMQQQQRNRVETPGTGAGERPLEQVPGTDVEVVHWTSPAGEGECTVVWLPISRLDVAVASAGVTETERERAAGYSREGDRLLCLGSAWLTRRLVAACLGVAPLEAPITRHCPQCARPHGRPVVGAATTGGATVHVSASHTQGLIGVALSTSGAIGLDLENLQARGPQAWPTVWRVLGRRPPPARPPVSVGPLEHRESWQGAAREAGHEAGHNAGHNAGREAGHEAALEAATAWVRTEAVLKATGHGLAVDSRSVNIRPGDEPAVTRWPWGDPAGRVSLFDLNPGGRSVAALAAIHDPITRYPLPMRTSAMAQDSPRPGTRLDPGSP